MGNIIKFSPKPELDSENFKKIVFDLKWTKKIRTMGNISQVFYSGILENEDKKIHVSIRPSMVMRVTESFKNRDIEGRAIKENQRPREIVNFGSTVEIRIDNSFLNKVEEIANNEEKKQPEVFKWSD